MSPGRLLFVATYGISKPTCLISGVGYKELKWFSSTGPTIGKIWKSTRKFSTCPSYSVSDEGTDLDEKPLRWCIVLAFSAQNLWTQQGSSIPNLVPSLQLVVSWCRWPAIWAMYLEYCYVNVMCWAMYVLRWWNARFVSMGNKDCRLFLIPAVCHARVDCNFLPLMASFHVSVNMAWNCQQQTLVDLSCNLHPKVNDA